MNNLYINAVVAAVVLFSFLLMSEYADVLISSVFVR